MGLRWKTAREIDVFHPSKSIVLRTTELQDRSEGTVPIDYFLPNIFYYQK